MVEQPYGGKCDLPIEFPPFTFVVERTRVRQLAQALQDDNPVYVDPEVAASYGLAGIPAPPLFLQNNIQSDITGVQPVDSMGIDRSRAMHAGQEYEYLAPVVVGDVLTGRTRCTSVSEKEGRSGMLRFITYESDFMSSADIHVARVTTRVVERLDEPRTDPV